MLAFKCYTKFNYSYWRIWEKQNNKCMFIYLDMAA